MRGNNMIALFRSPKIVLALLFAVAVFGAFTMPLRATAGDLPLAAGSPLTGLSFDDRPLLLPVQRNFQMAMLTASSQIGRSCGRMESYGWRTAQTEQQRVNLIFSNTVDRLRTLGYSVEAQTPSSISKDITLFTADKTTKHFLFMWSAGEIGLVMVLCESSPPLTGRMAELYNAAPAQIIPPPPQDVMQSKLETPGLNAKGHKIYDAETFTPVGDWVGSYTCMRGYTGATMHIDPFKGEDFRGTFRFYPTSKNTYVPRGSYEIYGQYDKQSKRILINPGKWNEHPTGYYKTIIVGSFDPAERTFSGFFQGIMGCTSFEAKYDVKSAEIPAKKVAKKHVKPKAKTAKKSAPKAAPDDTTPPSAPASDGIPPVTGDISLPNNTKTAVPTAPAAAPVAVVPPLAPVPSSEAPLAVAPSLMNAPAATAPPAPVTPESATPPAPPVSLPPAPEPTKPTSSLAPRPGPHAIILAGDWPPAPSAPSLPPAPNYNLNIPQVPVENYNTNPNKLQPTQIYDVNPHQVTPVENYNVNPTKLNETVDANLNVPPVPQPQILPDAQKLQPTTIYDTDPKRLPDTQTYSIYKAPGS